MGDGGADPSSGSGDSTASGGGTGPGIGVTIGVIVVIIVLAIASYVCTRIRLGMNHGNHSAGSSSSLATEQGRDSATMEIQGPDEHRPTGARFPKHGHTPGEMAVRKGGSSPKPNSSRSRCPICLREYKEGHALTSLPECHHLFHTKCIEPWLELNPSCPICRSSPVTTPESPPLSSRGAQPNRAQAMRTMRDRR